MKLYSFPKDFKYFIPEYLKENWNFIVYNTKCIHSWIALLKYVCRKKLPCIIETKLIYYLTRDIIIEAFMIQVISTICLMYMST